MIIFLHKNINCLAILAGVFKRKCVINVKHNFNVLIDILAGFLLTNIKLSL